MPDSFFCPIGPIEEITERLKNLSPQIDKTGWIKRDSSFIKDAKTNATAKTVALLGPLFAGVKRL